MLTNFSNVSSLPLFCPFNNSLYPIVFSCFRDDRQTFHFHLYTLTYLLLILPLDLFLLWVCFQRWRCKSPASGQTSHTDVFTYCMTTMDTLTVVGLSSYSYAFSVCSLGVMVVGYYCVCIGFAALTVSHCLTCIERYLAVVHPIVYMRLKKSHGVRIRNICVVLACLLSFGVTGFIALLFPVFPTAAYFSIFGLIVAVVSFCSLAVFCVLTGSGTRTDQIKWRAFHTIAAITATLALRFSGQIASIMVLHSQQETQIYCEIFFVGFWLCLPSSLVLPLLFMHRNLNFMLREIFR